MIIKFYLGVFRNAGVRCSSHLSGTIKPQQKQRVTEGAGVIVRSLIFCARTLSARLSGFPVVAGDPGPAGARQIWVACKPTGDDSMALERAVQLSWSVAGSR
jgi:hypothetical protein